MNGHKFEYKCARMLRRKGFHHVEVTKKSGDQGVDIIAYKHFSKYAVQCKYYSYPVGNKAVQEVYAGGKYYDCDRCIVMTNGTFTKAAISAANKLDVKLWDNCSMLKSTSLIFEIMRAMNILGILFGCYLLGWENWMLSTLAGALYLFLEFTFQGASNVPKFLAGGVNLVFLIPALIYFVHVYLLKPKP